MFHKIMVAYDESSEAGRALRASIELAKTLSAELSVVSVLEPPPGYYSFAVSAVPAFNWTEEKRLGTAHSRPKPGNRPRLQALCSMRN
jgi:nucleotide-binding universal stress UspA family protein